MRRSLLPFSGETKLLSPKVMPPRLLAFAAAWAVAVGAMLLVGASA